VILVLFPYKLAGKLMPNSILEKSWTYILADFIIKLPLAQGYDFILVVVDRLTKIVHFIPTTEKMLMGIKRFDHKTKVKARSCKGTVLFPPLNHIVTLWSSLSLFKYY